MSCCRCNKLVPGQESVGAADSGHPSSLLGLTVLLTVLALYFSFVFPVSTPKDGEERQAPHFAEGWTTMPAGARAAYIGIHGGTVPVSLLATSEGNRFVTFVGSTGNDFLNLLHMTDTRVPSFLNATRPDASATLPDEQGSHLMAGGGGCDSLPVIRLTGEGYSNLGEARHTLTPFGLSAQPLSIEGRPAQPNPLWKVHRYDIVVGLDFLSGKSR